MDGSPPCSSVHGFSQTRVITKAEDGISEVEDRMVEINEAEREKK